MRLFRLFLAVLLIAWAGRTIAQDAVIPTFSASKIGHVDRQQTNDLKGSFEEYTLLKIDHQAIYQFARQQKDFIHFQLDLVDRQIDLPLELNQLRKEESSIILGSNPTKKIDNDLPVYTYKGRTDLELDGQIRMTIHRNYISAFLLIDGEEYYLEPASRFTSTKAYGHYVWYNHKAVVKTSTATCATTSNSTRTPLSQQIQARSTCLETDLAVAFDYSYYIDHGSNYEQLVADMEEVFNIVDGIFQTDLNVDLRIMAYFISDCATCDPWTNSTNYVTLLNDFVSWGNAGGFLTLDYDVASFWTNRNLGGSVVGVAYLNAVCRSWRYNVNQDYTTNLGSLKTLWAHELGHNFGSHHDTNLGCPYGDIMWPSVNSNANSFSSCSVDAINNYLSGVTCLAPCGDCPVSENLTATLAGNLHVDVSQHITASNEILSSADVIYDAGNEITLTTNFHAQEGCEFLAVIDGCGGIYKNTPPPTNTPIAATDEGQVFIQNSPNPFKGETNIEYTLTTDTPISIQVFDLSGRLITNLVDNAYQTSGSYSLPFDARGLQSGIYIFQIQTDQTQKSGKMILLD